MLCGEASLAVPGWAWSLCVNNICLCGTLVHLRSGMAFYGSCLLIVREWKDKYLFKEQCQLPRVPTAAEQVGDGPVGGGAAAPGMLVVGCSKESPPPLSLPPPHRLLQGGGVDSLDLKCASVMDLLSLGAALSSPAFWLILRFKDKVCTSA